MSDQTSDTSRAQNSGPRDYRPTVFLPKTDFPMKAGLPQKEPEIQARWDAMGLYEKLREARAGREKFILHDGPPYANGDMHIGHALNHVLKDTVVRTQSLLGKDAPYVPGWDCHGLPIEWKVEELYRKKKRNKKDVPPAEFRAECRDYAAKWVDVQKGQLQRLGIQGRWDKPYLTMRPEAEAAIVGELHKFAETGQLYRGAKPVMWSPVEETALADAEVEYQDLTDSPQIDVAFEIVASPVKELVGAHAVIWTTTPWTIPVNQALAFGPEVEYLHIRLTGGMQTSGTAGDWGQLLFGRGVLVAKTLFQHLLSRMQVSGTTFDVLWSGTGSDLAGTFVRHPMATTLRHPREGGGPASSNGVREEERDPRLRGDDDESSANAVVHSADGAIDVPATIAAQAKRPFYDRLRPMLAGEFVATDSGTGIVHMSPDHGEDDFALCKANGIEPVFAVQGNGLYRDDWAWLGADDLDDDGKPRRRSVINKPFNAPEGPICSDLRDAGALLSASADYKHSYPHSWRSKAKVVYRCTPQWFIAIDQKLRGAPPSVRAELVEATPPSVRPELVEGLSSTSDA
ncbi:MAG: class I tRNA ligase family protein, partial [Pacificimonas sp.]